MRGDEVFPLAQSLLGYLANANNPTWKRKNKMETAHRLDLSTRDVILSMLERQPCTIRQLAEHCSSNRYEITKYLSKMSKKGLIMVKYINGQLIVSSKNPMAH